MANTIDDRCEAADAALAAYTQAKGEYRNADPDDLTDLLADLMHLAARDSGAWPKFEDALRSAKMHFDHEGEPCTSHRDNGRGICCDCGVAL